MVRLYACELEVFVPGSSTSTASNLAHSARPWAVAPDTLVVESTDTVRASDIGYRDATEGRVYPPLLSNAFEIDRSFALAPGADVVGATWGTMTLLNPEGVWDNIAATRSCDGRSAQIYTGAKSYDPSRGFYKDPAFSALNRVFSGVAKGWFLSETQLEIPLYDATYFIEKPLQNTFYLGSGWYEGPSTLAGTPKPKARGGTSSNPILNVTPVLVDATNLIYQYNDARGTVVALYEGGAASYSYAGDTNDLYGNPPPQGQYRTDNSRGMFRLGTPPIRPITCDVTGAFPSSAVRTTAANIALGLLLEDAAVDPMWIDTASFTTLNAAYPWTAGYYFSEETSTTEALSLFLRGVGAKLISTRDGRLRAMALRALAPGAVPATTLSEDHIVSLLPKKLGEPLDPPADLWRIGWNRNNTIQTSDTSPQVTSARKTILSNEWQIAANFSAAVNASYRAPSRPAVVPTALLSQAHAEALAVATGTLWNNRRRVFTMVVPLEIGLQRDLGDVIRLTYPLDDLKSGRLGVIVSESYRSTDSTMEFQVLV